MDNTAIGNFSHHILLWALENSHINTHPSGETIQIPHRNARHTEHQTRLVSDRNETPSQISGKFSITRQGQLREACECAGCLLILCKDQRAGEPGQGKTNITYGDATQYAKDTVTWHVSSSQSSSSEDMTIGQGRKNTL